jgi:ankyrin repeat protein
MIRFVLVFGMAALLTEPAPIADAAMRGDLATVRLLIGRGADVNAAQGDGMTALHWAAERADSAMAAVLLRARANERAVTRVGGYTPLHIAAKRGSAAVVKALLDAGSDAKVLTGTGATALHFAAASGNAASVAALVARGGDVNAREPEWGQTPLVFAAAKDRADAIRVLLRAGADPNLHTSVMNLTESAAVEQAAARRRNEVLVSFEPERHRDSVTVQTQNAGAAAPVRRPPPQPKGPFTPAQIQLAIDSARVVYASAGAAKGPVQEEVDTINGGVPGFAASVGGVGGFTALHHAVRQGNHAAVLALLDGGAAIDARSHADSTTPLLLAAINGHFDVAMTLLKRGANPNIASAAGATPLYAVINTQWRPRSRYPQPHAAEFQKATHLELMEALLAAKADPNVRVRQHLWYFAYNNCGSGNCGLENLEGTTAFWRAAYAVDLDAMRLLVKHGADPKIPSQRMRQGTDTTSQGAGGGGGRQRGGPPVTAATPEIDSAAKVVPPGVGTYPIHAAAGVGYGNGFAGNSHRHVPDGWMPAIKYLVEELGADVNQRDANGMTPLHHAASRGDNEMILYLVSKGGDVKAVSRNFRTTVDMANGPVQRLRPFPETIALLEKLGALNSHRCVSC